MNNIIAEDMKIGVVIPTYNRKDNLAILLESLAKQTTHDFSVVVADDGSTDGTKELIEELLSTSVWKDRLVWIDCGPNVKGRRGRARNIGVQNLPDDTSLIVMLDSDLIFDPNLISNYRSINDSNPARVIFGMVEWLPPTSIESVREYVSTDKFSILRRLVPQELPKLIQGTFVGTELRIYAPYSNGESTDHEVKSEWSLFTNTAVPIELFKKLGGFDENMEGYGYEDMELGARMSKAGARCIYASSCLALHIWHPKRDDKLCSIENQINLDYFLKKHGSNPYYENLVDWQYWWHYHKQRGGDLYLIEDRFWVVNSQKTKMLSLPDENWIVKLGFTKNDEITGKIDMARIEKVGEAFDPMELNYPKK